MEIIRDITNTNRTVTSGRSIKYIVIHYVGAVSSAKANAQYFKNTYRGASAHYFVDDNSCYQVVEEKDIAWHVGAKYYKHLNCRNSNSIGIEMCCFNNGGRIDVSENVANRTVELTKELMKKYNIPITNVLRHYDVTGKDCPAPFVNNPSRWTNFLNKLNQSGGDYKQGQNVEISVPFYFTGAVEGDRYLYDNKTELCWINSDTKSLIKNDNMRARALIAYVSGDKCIVQVFSNQFWIKTSEIVKVL